MWDDSILKRCFSIYPLKSAYTQLNLSQFSLCWSKGEWVSSSSPHEDIVIQSVWSLESGLTSKILGNLFCLTSNQKLLLMVTLLFFPSSLLSCSLVIFYVFLYLSSVSFHGGASISQLSVELFFSTGCTEQFHSDLSLRLL